MSSCYVVACVFLVVARVLWMVFRVLLGCWGWLLCGCLCVLGGC